MGKGKSKKKKVRITQDQGNLLFVLSTNPILPEKLGEGEGGRTYNVAERGLASSYMVALYDRLKGLSGYHQTKKLVLFGPADNWTPPEGENTSKCRLKDPDRDVQIRIDREIRQGAFWCLLLALHPASGRVLPICNQADTAWPLADRLGLRSELEKEIGIDKAKDRSLELDDNSEFEKEDEEETEEEAEEETAGADGEKTEAKAGKTDDVAATVPV